MSCTAELLRLACSTFKLHGLSISCAELWAKRGADSSAALNRTQDPCEVCMADMQAAFRSSSGQDHPSVKTSKRFTCLLHTSGSSRLSSPTLSCWGSCPEINEASVVKPACRWRCSRVKACWRVSRWPRAWAGRMSACCWAGRECCCSVAITWRHNISFLIFNNNAGRAWYARYEVALRRWT